MAVKTGAAKPKGNPFAKGGGGKMPKGFPMKGAKPKGMKGC